ncbi:MAG: methyltransferase domain-containing protein [Alphaproteobacteria bacterium]|nr:methyltransferase domain-containing protein [Alphaproteobacteria bacterium]
MQPYTNDYLLDKKVKIFQPQDGYRASTDAVFLSSLLDEKKVKQNAKILDVGSGTGAISLCLASRLKDKNVEILGIDIQNDLVELSNFSSQENGFASFLKYQNIDIRDKLAIKGGKFDFVITNPPYSDHDMPSPNKSKKIAHNHQDFDLTGWISFCLRMLKPKGVILLINRAEAINEIINAMQNKAGNIQILPIYSKLGQDAKRVAVIAEKTSKAITKILPPFYIHNEDSSYTDKAKAILRRGKGYF